MPPPPCENSANPFLQNQGKRTIESIEFTGYERTKLYVLERELRFSVGDDFDPVELNDAWARLEQLPFIAYVEVETNRPRPGVVELVFHVEEEGIFRWMLGLEYSRRVRPSWYGAVHLSLVNTLGRADIHHDRVTRFRVHRVGQHVVQCGNTGVLADRRRLTFVRQVVGGRGSCGQSTRSKRTPRVRPFAR